MMVLATPRISLWRPQQPQSRTSSGGRSVTDDSRTLEGVFIGVEPALDLGQHRVAPATHTKHALGMGIDRAARMPHAESLESDRILPLDQLEDRDAAARGGVKDRDHHNTPVLIAVSRFFSWHSWP